MIIRSELELHPGPRPEFVAKHPYAVWVGGVFHSRYRTVTCAAATAVDLGKHAQVINENSHVSYDFQHCWRIKTLGESAA